MPKQIIIAEQHRIAAVFWEDQIQELVVATGNHQVGDIYNGIVENVLPGIDAAFVNIGDPERNGFIHVTDLGPLRLKRTAGAITELLTPQQKVLVQVMKEPTGNKGPRLTGNISLPGRYLVLMPFGRGVNLSTRIKNENERNRLRALAILIKPAGMGLLVRTEAEGKAEEAIIEDLEALQKQWEAIQLEANSTRAPALLNRDDDFIQRVLRDMYTADVNRIVVDSHTGVRRVKQYLMTWSGGKSPEGVLIDHHRERLPILDYFRVNAAIREALKPRVDLPSGGYIIIEPTEALTVIDVNSGSFTRSATARETVLWTNCEAATEIARQLRLRNIAGVIIVDFIDMDSRKDQLQVLEHFNKALKADKARPQIAQLSELGLVELTRKRQGQNIYELFGQTCATCGGLGHLVHLPGEPNRTGEEVAEPLVTPPPVREVRAFRETPPPDPTWEARSEAVEDTQADDQLGIMYHPDYQERTGPNNSRRRRRRPRFGEAPLREESSKSPVRISAPLPIVNHFRPGLVAEPEGLSSEERITRTEEVGIPAVSGFRLPSADETGLSAGEERLRGPKPERPKPAKEIEPPEIISVEMTPEEQDVYALMGISPLVLINRPVKNPKSVIVSVSSPGESPQTPIPEELIRERSRGSEFVQQQLEFEPQILDIDASPVDSSVAEQPATYYELEVQEYEPQTNELTPEPAAVAVESEPETSTSDIRRRRRRSSATNASEG